MIQLSWFVQVRWAFLAAQLAVVLTTANLLPDHFPTATLLSLLVMSGISNLILKRCVRVADQIYTTVIPTTIAFDVAMLALGLSLSGGHANPFCSLFLIHIALAAVLLDARWMWATLALSSALYGALFMLPITLPEVSLHPHHGGASLHLVGMLVSFLLTAIILGIFLGRLTKQLSALRNRAARLGEIAAVGRLAADTAHELASPLNTVVLALESLCDPSNLERLPADAREDALLANRELSKAYRLLKEMPNRAGLTPGETPTRFDLSELLPDLLAHGATAGVLSGTVMLPRTALLSALKNLISNALQAGARTIEVSASPREREVTFRVIDNGSGVPASDTAKFVNPFVSGLRPQQDSGARLGLGLFIVQTFAEDLGGSFQLSNRNDARGAMAELTVRRFAT